jgi:hypothetical protein
LENGVRFKPKLTRGIVPSSIATSPVLPCVILKYTTSHVAQNSGKPSMVNRGAHKQFSQLHTGMSGNIIKCSTATRTTTKKSNRNRNRKYNHNHDHHHDHKNHQNFLSLIHL